MKKPWKSGLLRVSDNGRYLQNGETPFYWLGDTAWDLLQRLSVEEAGVYLKNRADKGFNVIQCVLTNAMIKNDVPSIYQTVEEQDLLNNIAPACEPYWQHVEKVTAIAQELGVYMGFLPIWGNVARRGNATEKNIETYTRFIAERFKSYPNIIWIMGGDIRGNENMEMWEIMGRTLKEITPDKLTAYHPFGRTCSAYWFAEKEWLELNMFQSGHRRYDQVDLKSWDDKDGSEPWYGEDNWRYVEAEYKRNCRIRPVLDGEPSYEQIPQGLHDPSQPDWQEHPVRRYAWWSVLAGSCGHTYGDNSIFQFWGTGHVKEFGAIDEWYKAIHHTGSGQMQYLKDLMLEIDFRNGKACQQVLLSGSGEKEERISAFGTEDALVLYSWLGNPFTLQAAEYGRMDGWWLDPATGSRSYFGQVDLTKAAELTPPVKKQGHNDWVCVLKKA